MYLVVGLGNIGKEYNNTRHNVGFMVIDKMIIDLASSTNINKSNFLATVIKSSDNLLVKPNTFMNNSGQSIFAIKEYYKITNENIIIIHDDLDLPFGTVRFKMGGGNGGHNGLKSLDACINKDYKRIRIGIGKPENKDQTANYVLSLFTKNEMSELQDIVSHTIKAIESFKTESINEVKSQFTLK